MSACRFRVETSTGDAFVAIVPQPATNGGVCHELAEVEAVIRSARTPGWITVHRLLTPVHPDEAELWVDFLLNLSHVVTFREPT